MSGFMDKLRGWFTPDPEATALADRLRAVLDPELGIDVVSMGLVREVTLDGGTARIRMTLSTPGCPVGPLIEQEVCDVVREAGWIPEVTMEFDPPWSPDDISPESRARLRG